MENSGFTVVNNDVQCIDGVQYSKYPYTKCAVDSDTGRVCPQTMNLTFRTDMRVPKCGLMLVGWGGCNGTTLTAGILANKHKLNWMRKEGLQKPDYYGSLTQCSTVKLGTDGRTGQPVHIPFHQLLPMVRPEDLVIGGWDLSGMTLDQAMERAEVLDYDLQRKVAPYMKDLKPLPGIYDPKYIASNQKDRVDHYLKGMTKRCMMNTITQDIVSFKAKHELDKVIVLWTANTECFSEVEEGLNDTKDSLFKSIDADHAEVSPSTLFACASIAAGCTYINGSPQNTFVPGVIEFAREKNVFIGGDDFKSGQTKMKSVLVDFLVSSGIKPTSIVSYNHLGNNDGKNLSAPEQFRSKEISKSNVVDDMVESNRLLYDEGEKPDHCVVIKYVPYVGDSKRAMDEYTSEIFMGGRNTIVMHNTCEDSLLASPIILDLVVLAELCERISISTDETEQEVHKRSYEKFDSILSVLSFMLKAPLVPEDTPVINALAAQRQCMVNIFKACAGLPSEHYMALEHKLPSMLPKLGGKRKREGM